LPRGPHLTRIGQGQDKVYIMHFHDLAKKDWQQLARRLQEANADISYLMDEKEKKGILGDVSVEK
jgi:extradiol dioxygenase family protein